MVLAVAVAVMALIGLVSGPRSEFVGEGPTRPYVVQPGDTLWSLARSLDPDGEIRGLVDSLSDQTGGLPLRAGQVIEVPRAADQP